MRKKIYSFCILISALAMLVSCSDYLTETDPNMLSSETYWRNLDDTKAGLNATYAALLNHFILNIPQESCRADMGWPGYGRPSPTGATMWYYQSYTSTTDIVERKWQALYLGIFRANQVIAGLEKIESDIATEEDKATWASQMGQARFLRGLYHFYLYESYNKGSIVIRDNVPSTLDDFNKSLSSATEVLAFIRKDLKYAYNNLPAMYEEAVDKGRVTSGAAATILGNSYLYEAQYDSAMMYYDDVINNAEYGYELVKDMSLMFTLAGELNSESILEICYNTEFRTELTQWDEESLSSRWAKLTAGNLGCLTPVWMTYAYKTEPMDSLATMNFYKDGSGNAVLRNVPWRASAMVTLVEDEQTMHYGGTVSETETFTATGWGFSRPKKYTNHDHLTDETESGGDAWKSEKNVTLNRLAEVYINQAECILKTNGNTQDAIDLLNDVRSRWGLVLLGKSNGDASHTYDEIDYSSDSLMEHIMYTEKPLELSNEGHMTRWIDIRRWGITSEIFNKRSQETFYAIDYTFTNTRGEEQTVQQASVVKEVPADYVSKFATIDYEYDQTTLNYNASVHDYFAIPSNETIPNSEVN